MARARATRWRGIPHPCLTGKEAVERRRLRPALRGGAAPDGGPRTGRQNDCWSNGRWSNGRWSSVGGQTAVRRQVVKRRLSNGRWSNGGPTAGGPVASVRGDGGPLLRGHADDPDPAGPHQRRAPQARAVPVSAAAARAGGVQGPKTSVFDPDEGRRPAALESPSHARAWPARRAPARRLRAQCGG